MNLLILPKMFRPVYTNGYTVYSMGVVNRVDLGVFCGYKYKIMGVRGIRVKITRSWSEQYVLFYIEIGSFNVRLHI